MDGGETVQRFEATVTTVASRVFVPLPFDPDTVWGPKAVHHVHGTVAGHPWRGPVERQAQGWGIRLGSAWLRDNGVVVGAQVVGDLAPEGPQLEDIGADVAVALGADAMAQSFFEGLPSFYRKNFMRWIDAAKRPETRAKRIFEMIDLLREGRRER